REAHVGETSFYQGFIGDWDRLKPELLRRIQDEFPEADLIPVTSDEGISEWQVINLPVRLQVPEIPGGAARVAWRQVRGPLITMWAAGAAVLVVAGFGLWNLVSLMERRMQFAYGVTHELRTPLTTFRLYSDMLSAGLVPESARQEYLDTLNRESIRLASLVEDVLEYARLESNKVRLSVTETDGPSLLATIEETLVERCRKNGVRPQTENAVLNGEPIRTDVDLVHRIATVLVDNGVRHARGREDAVVLVRLRADHDHLLLDVIDSGPGIDRRDARTIFKPFRRGRNSETSAQGGIGLGLALARSWAQLLGGRLELVARRHEHYGGAHFRLIIPSHPRTAS
ncbi:MAG: sensor histidine kinase, partial [Planctomycetota bacterium]